MWQLVAAQLPGRTAKQCRERYINHLRPGLDRSPLTKSEWRVLQTCRAKFGNKWSLIAEHFENRTPNHIKNQYHRFKRSVERKFVDEFEDDISSDLSDSEPIFSTRKRSRKEAIPNEHDRPSKKPRLFNRRVVNVDTSDSSANNETIHDEHDMHPTFFSLCIAAEEMLSLVRR